MSGSIIYADFIVDLDSLMQDSREDMLSICSPSDPHCAISLGLSDFLVAVEGPEIDFSCEVSETTYQDSLREWANSHCVSISFSILK